MGCQTDIAAKIVARLCKMLQEATRLLGQVRDATMILVDTGAWLALANRGDAYHARSRDFSGVIASR